MSNNFDKKFIETNNPLPIALEKATVTRIGDLPKCVGQSLLPDGKAHEFFIDLRDTSAQLRDSVGAIFFVTSSKKGRRMLVDEAGKELKVQEGKVFLETIDGFSVKADAQRLIAMSKEPLRNETLVFY